MRPSLFYNPLDVIERLALSSQRWRRRRKLTSSPAAQLGLGHLDSLELLELLANRPPAVIYDIGANAGTWTCLAKSIYPAARVIGIEPLKQHHRAFLECSSKWEGEVQLFDCALGPRSGRAMMQVMNFSDASSILKPTATGEREFSISATGQTEVKMCRLDDLISDHKLPAPDLLKLDVQGYELEVMRGAEGALQRAKAIICEVSFESFYAGQALAVEVFAFLHERGFRIHSLGVNTPLGQRLVQTDVLFLSTS